MGTAARAAWMFINWVEVAKEISQGGGVDLFGEVV